MARSAATAYPLAQPTFLRECHDYLVCEVHGQSLSIHVVYGAHDLFGRSWERLIPGLEVLHGRNAMRADLL